MKNQNRSKKFDYFSNPNSKENKKKSWLKKIWFWVKTIIYVLLFGLTMTGCVQTMVINTSTYSGAGTEFYTSDTKYSPFVSTFSPNTQKVTQEDKILEDGEFYTLKHLSEKNYHLSGKQYADVIKELRTQTEQNGGEYAKYNSYSSAIQYIDKDGKFVTPLVKGNNGNYLFMSSTATNYQSIYADNSQIKFLDPDFNLSSFFKYDEENKVYNVITPQSKENALANYENEDKDKRDPYYAIVKYENKTLRAVKRATLFTLPTQSEFSSYIQKYNYDILLFLMKNTFDVENNIYQNVLSQTDFGTYNDWLGDIVSLEPTKKTYSVREYNALIKYNEVLYNYIKLTNLNTTTKANRLVQIDQDGKEVTDKNGNLVYSVSYKENATFGIMDADKNGNLNYKISFLSTTPQKAISSWGEAWRHWGPFYGLVVWPIAAITTNVREQMPAWAGWSSILVIFIAVVITRVIVLLFTFKSLVRQSKQEDLRDKKAKIDAKYAGYQNNKQMKQRHQQEVAALYKKNGISMMDPFIQLLITTPLFLAMWRVIQSIPEIKSTLWLTINFAATSWRKLFSGEWQYLPLLLVAAVFQVVSQLLPRLLTRKKVKERTTIDEIKALKKNNRTQNIMMIIFLVFTLAFSAGVQIYWIFSSFLSIIQTIAIHYYKKSAHYRKKYIAVA